ncbi:GTP-binding protein YchF [Blastocladiella britannica]|nr:GTP-binding protein YchF [Blastocladiella britannica]
MILAYTARRPPYSYWGTWTRHFSASRAILKKRSAGASTNNDDDPPQLGRPSNNLKLGVVGLPNVGKSSIFNVITNSNVLSANYPFATIDPSEGRVAVPDPRFDALVSMYKPQATMPSWLSVTDIAGLVRGASSGAGLGNNFLAHIRAVDGLYHVVRCFRDPGIVHVENSVDPCRDLEIIHDELRIKDMDFLEAAIEDARKRMGRTGGQSAADLKVKREELDTLERVLDWTMEKDVRLGKWTREQVAVINRLQLLTAKPVVYLANVSEEEYLSGEDGPEVKSVLEWVDVHAEGDLVIPISAGLEETLSTLDAESRKEYLDDAPVTSALPDVISAGYDALGLINYFTAGPGEVRAWTVRKGSKAPQAAGVIHTDFERGFIAAEVMSYSDLSALGSEAAVKSAGKYAQRGREYVIQSGDVCYFKFNVTKGNKK